MNGLRTRKIVDGQATDYYLHNDKIITQISGNDRLDFLYDETQHLIGCLYNGQKYYYLFNNQNDVIDIVDEHGKIVVSYTYDTWGRIVANVGSMASTLGQLNPFRYRSYCYDEETGLYYLNSRYYDPVTGRYLNPDVVLGANDMDPMSYNLYVYCNNDPVNRMDPTGHFFEWVKNTVNKVVNTVKNIFNTITGAITSGVQAFFNGCETLGRAIGNVYNDFTNTVSRGISNFRSGGGSYTPYDAGYSVATSAAEEIIKYEYKTAVSTLKPVSKIGHTFGLSKSPLGVVSYGMTMWENLDTYTGWNLAGATIIDTVSFLGGIFLSGAVVSALTGVLPAAAVFLIGAGVCIGVEVLASFFKDKIPQN